VPGRFEIFVNQRIGAGMQRQVARFVALAGDLEMRHAAPCVLEILDLQLAELVAPKRVIQQRRQDRTVALVLDPVFGRRCQEIAGLVIADCRRLAFATFTARPLDAFDWIMGNSVLVAKILEQRRQRRQPVPDRGLRLRWTRLSARKRVAMPVINTKARRATVERCRELLLEWPMTRA
jgi:hypothetical protein